MNFVLCLNHSDCNDRSKKKKLQSSEILQPTGKTQSIFRCVCSHSIRVRDDNCLIQFPVIIMLCTDRSRDGDDIEMTWIFPVNSGFLMLQFFTGVPQATV